MPRIIDNGKKIGNKRNLNNGVNNFFTHHCNNLLKSCKYVNLDDNVGCLDHCYPIECPDILADMIGDVDIQIFQRSVVKVGNFGLGGGSKSLCLDTDAVLPIKDEEAEEHVFNPNSSLICLGPNLCDDKKVTFGICDWSITFWAKLKLKECVDAEYVLLSQDVYDEESETILEDLKLVLKYDCGLDQWSICLTVCDEQYCEDVFFSTESANFFAITYNKYKQQTKVYLNEGVVLCFDKEYKYRNSCLCIGWFSQSVAQYCGDDIYNQVSEDPIVRPWCGYIDQIYIFPYQLSEDAIDSLRCKNKLKLKTCVCEYEFEHPDCSSCNIKPHALIKSLTIPLCMNTCRNVCDIQMCECIKVTLIRNGSPPVVNNIISIKSINEWPCTISVTKNGENDLVRLILDFNKMFCYPLKLECGDILEVSVDTGAFIKELKPIIITGCVVSGEECET